MKTTKNIIDAVNELKGDFNNSYLLSMRETCDLRSADAYVLFKKEFNQCVEDMKTNFGKCSEIDAYKYQTAKKTLLEVENNMNNEIDYTSEEFWEDAPEGATHYGLKTDSSMEGWFLTTDKGYMFCAKGCTKFFGSGTQGFGPCLSIPMYKRPAAKPAEEKPVYTQAMCRADEVPVIGSEIVMRYMHDSCTVTHQGIVKYASLDNVILDIEGNERHLIVGDYAWEPIDIRTDKEKAIDEASKIVNSDGTCNKLNINIDCSAAMKAVICALVNNGWSKS